MALGHCRWILSVVLALLFALLVAFHDDEFHHENIPLYRATEDVIASVSAPGVQLHFKEWIVDSPVGIIVITHGFGEHIARYQEVAEFYNAASYSVYGIDHQGHGYSGGDRAYVRNFYDYTADVLSFVEATKLKLLEKHTITSIPPFYLLGHSMGGAIALQTAFASSDLWKGVIVSAPSLERVPSPILFLSEAISYLNPKSPLIGFALDLEGLNRNSTEVEKYMNDDLIYSGCMKVGWGRSIIKGIRKIFENAPNWHLPLLILHGEGDTITKISDTEEFVGLLPAKSTKFKRYPGTRHELFLENNRMEIMNDVLDWLKGQK